MIFFHKKWDIYHLSTGARFPILMVSSYHHRHRRSHQVWFPLEEPYRSLPRPTTFMNPGLPPLKYASWISWGRERPGPICLMFYRFLSHQKSDGQHQLLLLSSSFATTLYFAPCLSSFIIRHGQILAWSVLGSRLPHHLWFAACFNHVHMFVGKNPVWRSSQWIWPTVFLKAKPSTGNHKSCILCRKVKWFMVPIVPLFCSIWTMTHHDPPKPGLLQKVCDVLKSRAELERKYGESLLSLGEGIGPEAGRWMYWGWLEWASDVCSHTIWLCVWMNCICSFIMFHITLVLSYIYIYMILYVLYMYQ